MPEGISEKISEGILEKIPKKIWNILEAFTESAGRIFGEGLVGVYLHGSLAMNCFHPDNSDIDLIVVVEGDIADGQKMGFMEDVVRLNRSAPEKGIEMSVVKKEFCRNFVYPTPYELHFSPTHLGWFERNPAEYIRKMNGTDKDLAAHFTIIRHYGAVLRGAPIEEVFAGVPPEDYADSILCDIEHAKEEMTEHPLYITLNLCRVAAFLEEGKVLSKRQGGEWGLEKLPPAYHDIARSALECYTALPVRKMEPDRDKAEAFCDYMLKRLQDNGAAARRRS